MDPQWLNEIESQAPYMDFLFLLKTLLYAGFNVFVYGLITYCMTNLILLGFLYGSLASTYRL